MAEIAEYNENIGELRQINLQPKTLNDSLFDAAANIVGESKNQKVGAVLVFTKSGYSVRAIAKYRLGIPIIAISDQESCLMRLSLSYSVIPFYKKFAGDEYRSVDPVFDEIKNMGLVKSGETIMVIHGSNWFDSGSTNHISLQTA